MKNNIEVYKKNYKEYNDIYFIYAFLINIGLFILQSILFFHIYLLFSFLLCFILIILFYILNSNTVLYYLRFKSSNFILHKGFLFKKDVNRDYIIKYGSKIVLKELITNEIIIQEKISFFNRNLSIILDNYIALQNLNLCIL